MVNQLTDSGRSLLQHAIEVFFGGQQPGSSLDVFIQDQHTPPFQYFLMDEQKDDIALVTGTTVGETIVYVDPGHGFVDSGQEMVIREGSTYTQSEVIGVAGDDITLSSPLASNYSLDAQVVRGVTDMNVSGSVSSALYTLPMWGETPIDIQTIRITMQHGSAGDDSKFGNLSVLPIGLLFRKTNSSTQALGNYKQNQDFRELGATIDYTEKAGGGNHATNITFDIKNTYGLVIRLDPLTEDIFSALVQDNLNNLIRLKTSLMGHFTLGE